MPPKTESKFATAKTVISTIGSFAAAAMVVRSVARDYLPPEFQTYLHFGVCSFINKLSRHLTLVIYEFDGYRDNEVYSATEVYLAARITPPEIHRLKITKNRSEKDINVAMENNEEFTDVYNGINFKWALASKKMSARGYYDDEDVG